MKVRKGQFAKMMGLSPGRISQYISEGILDESVLPDGTLDLDIALREVKRNVDPLKKMDYRLRYDVQEKLKRRPPSLKGIKIKNFTLKDL